MRTTGSTRRRKRAAAASALVDAGALLMGAGALLVAAVSPLGAQGAGRVTPDSAAALLTAERLEAHVRYLGSDELAGRGTGSPGYHAATAYGARMLDDAGLAPGARRSDGDSTFIQVFEVPVTRRFPGGASYNVIGVLRGADPALADEWVTVGAHLDGLGVLRPGGIHNGANDNATGSAVVMELARAVVAAAPRRSVAFMLWGAEEVGHWGSRHWVANPTLPLDGVVAHVNLDGVGRYDRSRGDVVRMYALGAAEICPEYHATLVAANARSGGLELDTEDREGWFPYSDHYQFHRAGVPSVFLTDFGSEDYHTPRDDWEAIDYAKLRTTALTALEFVLTVAQADAAPCG
jgi:hypothetical protein